MNRSYCNTKWSYKLTAGRPRGSKRSFARHKNGWRDDDQKVAGRNWMSAAKGRQHWKNMGEAHTQEWMKTT